MIRKFQKYSSSLVAKLFLILIAASFVMWGIGDMFGNVGSASYLARVGERSIGTQEFQQQMNLRLNNYRELLGAEYSPEIIKRLGLPQQVLSEMMNNLLLQNEAESLGLRLSDVALRRMVADNESFHGENGSFDKDTFHAALRRAGITEDAYLKSLRQDTSSSLLLAHLDGSALVQRPALEALYRLRGETREATVYVFSPESLGNVPEPSEKDLAAYYEKNKEQFRTPELRRLSYLVIDPQTIRKAITLKESALRELYENRKEEFRSPEKRALRQLLYSHKEKATHALNLLQQGKSFDAVARAVKPTNKELSLGTLTDAELVGEARAPVFGLPRGGHSGVIESSFGWHLFQVDKVIPSRIPDYADIKPQLRQELLDSALEDRLYQLSTELEDQVAGGASLADIAKEMKFPIRETGFFDAQGKLQDKKSLPLPPIKALAQRVFSGDMENIPEFQSGSDGKNYFLSVSATHASVVPALKDARARVLTQWKQENRARRLSEKVTQAAARLKQGKADFLKGMVYETHKINHITRSGAHPEEDKGYDFPQTMEEELFTLKAGQFTESFSMKRGDWVIARLDATHPLTDNTITDADLESLRNEMNEQYSNELMQLYLAHLRRKFPVQVNEAVLNSVLK